MQTHPIVSAGIHSTSSSSLVHKHWSSDSCLDRKIRAHIQTQKWWHLGKVFPLCNQGSFSTLSSASGHHVSFWQGTIRFNGRPFCVSYFLQALSLRWKGPRAHSQRWIFESITSAGEKKKPISVRKVPKGGLYPISDTTPHVKEWQWWHAVL